MLNAMGRQTNDRKIAIEKGQSIEKLPSEMPRKRTDQKFWGESSDHVEVFFKFWKRSRNVILRWLKSVEHWWNQYIVWVWKKNQSIWCVGRWTINREWIRDPCKSHNRSRSIPAKNIPFFVVQGKKITTRVFDPLPIIFWYSRSYRKGQVPF